MKILGIGAGPAALYFSILIKKRFPKWEVSLRERNRPHETFGWGVVFSDETLGYLSENDDVTHRAITEDFAHWDAIDIHVRGETFRSGGHGFSGISRRRLLQILEARALELGVDIAFERDVTDPGEIRRLRGECDLLLAADGLRSATRGVWAEHFRPSLDVRQCHYMWLGTSKRFDAFTFLFAENEHGLFQVHAYRFDETTSTFIVECDDASWRAAGLDQMTPDESVAYCERLFANWLDGHALRSNRSQWIQFPTVRNERWSHDGVVLLGDAAHTAHYSIGSGTKLAMEDGIALARAFDEGGDLATILDRYETERRPVVERIQRAAQDSLQWFEHVKRYWTLPPWQFAFSLLSRSKKISFANLAKRDEPYARGVQRAFVATTPARDATPVPPPMFTPFTLRGLELPNRVVVSPMCMYSAVDGTVSDFHLVHYGSRAQGGAGLVICEMTDVEADGRITPGCAGMYKPEHVPAWRRVTDFIHQHTRAKVGIQLGHAGRKGATRVMWEGIDQPLTDGAWPLIAPSAIPYLPQSQTPRAMDRGDMDRVRAAFERATDMALAAGFDMLELHCAHGYLLASFLSPLTNRRGDAYGGAIENRARFPLEVFDAVRARWPAERPMSVRVSATDWHADGITDDDVRYVAAQLKARGCDIVDVSTGQTVPDAKPQFGRMYQLPWADMIRNEVGIPTMSVGAISSFDQVNTIVTSGRADLCVLARPHLADPFWTLHAAEDQGYSDAPWPVQYLAGKK